MAEIETSAVISAKTDDLRSGMEAAANAVRAATEAMQAQFANMGVAAQQAQLQISDAATRVGSRSAGAARPESPGIWKVCRQDTGARRQNGRGKQEGLGRYSCPDRALGHRNHSRH